MKGMGCLCKMAGIDFIIIDRAQGVGGTWWYNRFPGAQVDVFSHTYRLKGPSLAQSIWIGLIVFSEFEASFINVTCKYIFMVWPLIKLYFLKLLWLEK